MGYMSGGKSARWRDEDMAERTIAEGLLLPLDLRL